MTITFDHDDAFGMTDLEAYNYVPDDSHVIGNLAAAEIAIKRYSAHIEFKGVVYEEWPSFLLAYHGDLNERGISFS